MFIIINRTPPSNVMINYGTTCNDEPQKQPPRRGSPPPSRTKY